MMLKKLIKALDEPTVLIRKLNQCVVNPGMVLNGDYDFEKERIRLHKHTPLPLERVLIHEMLHYLYPKKPHPWINKWEKILWGRLSRQDLEALRKAVAKAKRRK